MDDLTDALSAGCGCLGSPPVVCVILVLLVLTILRMVGVIPDYWWQNLW